MIEDRECFCITVIFTFVAVVVFAVHAYMPNRGTGLCSVVAVGV